MHPARPVAMLASTEPHEQHAVQRRAFMLGLAASGLVVAHATQAQTYPVRPVRIIVGSAAGATPDVFIRILAQRLTEKWGGVPVVVENKPGASGTLAADAVAKSPPDGYTLLFADSSSWAINPHLYRKLPYDPARDLVPVLQVGRLPMFLVARSSLAVNSVSALVALARRQPGKLTYGSAGNGSIHHLSGELFKSTAGIDVVHVPYKGASQVGVALMANEIDLAFMGYTAASQGIASGKVRLLAIATDKRSATFPDLPTLAESGMPGFAMAATAGMMAPARTPPDLVDRLQSAMAQAAARPETAAQLAELGVLPEPSSTVQFAATVRAELERFGRLVKLSGAHVD